ncbi:hypothetical protein KR093_006367, partial [Drosophila rubida]
PISPCEQLKLDILQIADIVAREVLSQFAKLLQLVVDDAAQMDVTEAEKCHLAKFVNLIEVSKHMEELNVLEIFDEVEMILELEDESDESAALIEELLEKHGIEALEKHLDEIFQNFFMQLENHIELYFIRNEHRLSTSPLDVWLTKFTNEKSMESKAMIIEEIWDHLDC